MKIAIALLTVFLLLFLIVIGVPYKYEKESFSISKSPDTEINISIDPTVKETFLGMPVVHASPYKISIFCFDEGCLPEIHKISIQVGDTNISLDGKDPVITQGGLNTLSEPPKFSYNFNVSDSFEVSLSVGDSHSNLVWVFQYEALKGFSFLPLWVYFIR